MRKILYVTGTRADFGLMRRTLQQAANDKRLDVSVCVTGMHLLPEYGETVREIEAAGLRIAARIPVRLDGSSGAVMARALAAELAGMVDAFERERPDIVVVLGDRGEMLAGALAAIHLNIPIAHLHGGELSGTVDEPIRHAISKLSHYHFVATQGARERLIRMGERPENIMVSGAPGLDGLEEVKTASRADLCGQYGINPAGRVALMVFHPVLQEAAQAGRQAESILTALQQAQCQALCLMPNSDAGGMQVREVLRSWSGTRGIKTADHLLRDEYLSWLTVADVLVGNSSGGIIEAASFGLPVVNIGSRQQGRERNANVVGAGYDADAIYAALEMAMNSGRRPGANIYGDGRAGERIVNGLATLPITAALLEKRNAY
jgi:GDP/UDP-N,N'-diacetylbacillosamine 2-epimerase (hydrolysing)